MADPNSSGTAWTMLATIVQLMGEDKGVRLPRSAQQEHRPVHRVPARRRPWRSARARRMVGIAFQHDVIDVAKHNRPVKVVSPCEGTGYEIGSMSLIKGAPATWTRRRNSTSGR